MESIYVIYIIKNIQDIKVYGITIKNLIILLQINVTDVIDTNKKIHYLSLKMTCLILKQKIVPSTLLFRCRN
jgi:hypothetical protein